MDKNTKLEIIKNNDSPKEKEKSKENPKDITDLKNYKIPDAANKKYFDKINNYNIIGILKYIYFPEMIEISFTNHKFNKLINKKCPNRIPIVKKSLKTFKQKIVFNFSEDFRFVLKKNSLYTTNLTKKMIDSLLIEYFPKMTVKRFFLVK